MSVQKGKMLLRAALVCSKNLPDMIKPNLDNHLKWLEYAKSKDVDFVGFPECSLTGYSINKGIALDISGKEIKALEEIIIEKKIYASIGFIEKYGRFYYNSHALFGPSGLIGVMRKINLTPGERKVFHPGKTIPVFNIGTAKLGIAICADSNGPEIPRILSFNEVEIIFAPFATPGQAGKNFESEKKYGFFASQCCSFYLACNNAGKFKKAEPNEASLSFSSGAVIYNPAGVKIACSGKNDNKESILIADLNLSEVNKTRENSYAFTHFGPEKFYGKFIKR